MSNADELRDNFEALRNDLNEYIRIANEFENEVVTRPDNVKERLRKEIEITRKNKKSFYLLLTAGIVVVAVIAALIL